MEKVDLIKTGLEKQVQSVLSMEQQGSVWPESVSIEEHEWRPLHFYETSELLSAE